MASFDVSLDEPNSTPPVTVRIPPLQAEVEATLTLTGRTERDGRLEAEFEVRNISEASIPEVVFVTSALEDPRLVSAGGFTCRQVGPIEARSYECRTADLPAGVPRSFTISVPIATNGRSFTARLVQPNTTDPIEVVLEQPSGPIEVRIVEPTRTTILDPGEEFPVVVRLVNGSNQTVSPPGLQVAVTVDGVTTQVPAGRLPGIPPGQSVMVPILEATSPGQDFELTVRASVLSLGSATDTRLVRVREGEQAGDLRVEISGNRYFVAGESGSIRYRVENEGIEDLAGLRLTVAAFPSGDVVGGPLTLAVPAGESTGTRSVAVRVNSSDDRVLRVVVEQPNGEIVRSAPMTVTVAPGEIEGGAVVSFGEPGEERTGRPHCVISLQNLPTEWCFETLVEAGRAARQLGQLVVTLFGDDDFGGNSLTIAQARDVCSSTVTLRGIYAGWVASVNNSNGCPVVDIGGEVVREPRTLGPGRGQNTVRLQGVWGQPVDSPEVNGVTPAATEVSDPVQVATGNFLQPERDLDFGPAVFGMALGRFYNSSSTADYVQEEQRSPSLLGPGWRPSHQITAVTEADGVVAVTSGDGRILRFTPGESRTGAPFERPPLFYGDLFEVDDRFVVANYDGTRWYFDDQGRVDRMTSPDGQSVTIAYQDGLIHSIVSSTGLRYELRYHNRLLAKVNAVGPQGIDRWVEYRYQKGHLHQVEDPDGAVMTYEVDGTGLITEIRDEEDILVVENEYDEARRVIRQENGAGEVAVFVYDPVERLTEVAITGDISTGMSRTDRYFYSHDDLGFTIDITDPLDRHIETIRNRSGEPEMVIDRRANELSTTPDAGDAGAQAEVPATKRSYDDFGNVLTETIPEIGTWTYTYYYDENATAGPPAGMPQVRLRSVTPPWETQPGASTTHYFYDGANVVPSRIIGPLGYEVTNEIVDGLLRRSTDSDGVAISYDYDEHRRLEAVTDGVGNRVDLDYDAAGRLVETLDPRNGRTRFDYDQSGRLLEVEDRAGATARWTYDDAGRLEEFRDPLHGAAAPSVVDIDYHPVSGLIETVTDQRTNQTSFAYNEFSQLIGVDQPGNADTPIATTTFDYVELGRLTAATDALPEGRTTIFDHDAEGQLEQIVGADPEAEVVIEYDQADRPVRITDPNKIDTVQTFNAVGQLESVTYAAGSDDEITIGYTYDAAGRIKTIDGPRPGQVTTYSYTPAGRIGSVSTVATTDGSRADYVTRYRYDPAGRIESIERPEGEFVRYRYDANSRPVIVETSLGLIYTTDYDPEGRVTQVSTPAGVVNGFGYDANGSLTSTSIGTTDCSQGECPTARFHGVRLVSPPGRPSMSDPVPVDLPPGTHRIVLQSADRYHGPSQSSQPAEIWVLEALDADGEIVFTTRPTDDLPDDDTLVDTDVGRYDTTGVVAVRARHAGIGAGPDSIEPVSAIFVGAETTLFDVDSQAMNAATDPNGGVMRYDYDGRYNLTGFVDQRGNLDQYTYDLADQLTVATDALDRSTLHSYDSLGRLQNTTDPTARSFTNDYDPAGRLERTTYADGSFRQFTYDDLDRVVTVTDQPSGATISYDYDAAGNLTQVTEPDGDIIGYQWDLLGNLTEITYPDRATVEYRYDQRSRLEEAEHSAHGTMRYSYDDDNRVTQIDFPDGNTRHFGYTGEQLTTFTDQGKTWHLDYDSSGRLIEITGHDHRTFTYDQAGQLLTATDDDRSRTYTYDPAGNLTSIDDTDAPTRRFTHNDADELDTIDEVTVTHDDAGRLTNRTVGRVRTDYSYDVRGRLETVTTTEQPEPVDPAIGGTITYRNQTAAAEVQVELFTGAEDGRRLGHLRSATTDEAGFFRFDDINPGCYVVTLSSPDDLTFVATGTGFLERPVCVRDVEVVLDLDGVLDGDNPDPNTEPIAPRGPPPAGEPIVETWSRTYTPDGLVDTVTHTNANGTTSTWRLTWDRTTTVPQPLGWTGTSDVDLIGGLGTELAATDGQATTIGRNPLGDIISSAASVNDHYDPYGNPGQTSFGLGYRGELHLGPTLNLKARDLDPTLGRFLTVDPLASPPGQAATTPYAYAANDPINRRDPLGLAATDADLSTSLDLDCPALVDEDSRFLQLTDPTDRVGGGRASGSRSVRFDLHHTATFYERARQIREQWDTGAVTLQLNDYTAEYEVDPRLIGQKRESAIYGVWLDFAFDYEVYQGSQPLFVSDFPFIQKTRFSSFSFEDMPSNYLGFLVESVARSSGDPSVDLPSDELCRVVGEFAAHHDLTEASILGDSTLSRINNQLLNQTIGENRDVFPYLYEVEVPTGFPTGPGFPPSVEAVGWPEDYSIGQQGRRPGVGRRQVEN